MQASEDDEDAKKLIRDIRGLKKRCQLLEAETDALSVTNCELQTAVSDRDEQLERQKQVIGTLEATIHDQSSDIRTALQLVMHWLCRSSFGAPCMLFTCCCSNVQ